MTVLSFFYFDDIGITADARILATSKGCPRQIIRYSPSIYGFQCHPEPTKENIETMIKHCPNDLAPGKYIQSSEELLSNNFTEINNRMIQILNNLIASTNYLEVINGLN
jgi:GMP synthase (glutamine-hydrolysing)